jgi:hypothetical protein
MFSKVSDTAEYATQRASQVDISAIQQQILALAKEYEYIRATMDSGDPRTRKMEIIATKMRSLALSAYSLVQELAQSNSPGQRLAAVSILQAIPTPEYFFWLAERPKEETPFITYHAAVALLNAVRTLDASYYEKLNEAIETAKKGLLENLGPSATQTDRFAVLGEAQKELQSLREKQNEKR